MSMLPTQPVEYNLDSMSLGVMPKEKKVICVLSGGMDSVTLLHKLVDDGKQVKAISFNYGQIHVKELEMAAWQCEKLGIEHKIIDVTFLKDLLPSTLTGVGNVPYGHYESDTMKQTVVPFRNTILSSLALGYASGLGYNEIALGVHAGDHAIYPDCRPEFIQALQRVADLGDYNRIKIYTPYLYVTKIEIIAEGKRLGVDYSKTWTSYSSGDEPDYKTSSSVERSLGFIRNGIADPLYTPEQWQIAKEYALAQKL